MERMELESYLDKSDVEGIVFKLACKLRDDYEGKNPLFLGILNGSVIFLSDLVREVNIPLEFDFIRARSYRGSESTGHVEITKDFEADVSGRHVVVVEDIVDTSRTLEVVMNRIQAESPASLECCTLLLRNNSVIMPKYFGRIVDKGFVVGYGLDFNQAYRELSYIGTLPGTKK